MWFFKKYHDKNNYMWNQFFSKITHFQENDVEDGLSDLDLKVNSVSVTNVKVKMLQKYFMFCTFDVLLLDSILIWHMCESCDSYNQQLLSIMRPTW